mgnify:CR=1 FL=1
MNAKQEFTQEEIQHRTGENSEMYFNANACAKHVNCLGCPDYDIQTEICGFSHPEESYWW